MSPQVNRRGRPSVSPKEASTDVHLTMSESLYDRAFQRAMYQRVSVQDIIRKALDKDLRNPK
jgi:hypothetical protein